MKLIYLDIEGSLVTIKSMFKATFDYYGVKYTARDFAYDNMYGISEQVMRNLDISKALDKKPEPAHLSFPNYTFDKNSVDILNMIYDKHKCAYIIIGQFSKLTISQLNLLFRINGVHGVVIGKTKPILPSLCYTKKYYEGETILTHMAVNNPDISKCCIITHNDTEIKPLFNDITVKIDPRSGLVVQDLSQIEKTFLVNFSHYDVIHSLNDINTNTQTPWIC